MSLEKFALAALQNLSSSQTLLYQGSTAVEIEAKDVKDVRLLKFINLNSFLTRA